MPGMVQSLVKSATEHGCVMPTWAQGQYNLVCCANEKGMCPLLRIEGIKFAAYTPYAGGFLHGNFARQVCVLSNVLREICVTNVSPLPQRRSSDELTEKSRVRSSGDAHNVREAATDPRRRSCPRMS